MLNLKPENYADVQAAMELRLGIEHSGNIRESLIKAASKIVEDKIDEYIANVNWSDEIRKHFAESVANSTVFEVCRKCGLEVGDIKIINNTKAVRKVVSGISSGILGAIERNIVLSDKKIEKVRQEIYRSGGTAEYHAKPPVSPIQDIPQTIESPLTLDNGIPYPDINVSNIVFDDKEILPLSKETAAKLNSNGLYIFKMSDKRMAGAVKDSGDIANHEGVFGVHRNSWEDYYIKHSESYSILAKSLANSPEFLSKYTGNVPFDLKYYRECLPENLVSLGDKIFSEYVLNASKKNIRYYDNLVNSLYYTTVSEIKKAPKQENEIDPRSLIGKHYVIDDREMIVESVNLEWNNVKFMDVEMYNNGYPISRSEKLDFLLYIENEERKEEQAATERFFNSVSEIAKSKEDKMREIVEADKIKKSRKKSTLPDENQFNLFDNPVLFEETPHVAQSNAINRKYTGTIQNQAVIDNILSHGGTDRDSLLRIIAHFQKGKSVAENAAFLEKDMGDNTGRGHIVNGEKYSAWFDVSGIRIGKGDSIYNSRSYANLTWEQAAERVGELLEQGQFTSKINLVSAWNNEYKRCVEMVRELWRNNDNEVNEFFLPREVFAGSIEEEDERIGEMLRTQETLQTIIDGVTEYAELCEQNRDVYRLRHIYQPHDVANLLKDLWLEPIQFNADSDFEPASKLFITDDELNNVIRKAGYYIKYKIVEFFKEKHTTQEKVKFLKKLYGIGGSSH